MIIDNYVKLHLDKSETKKLRKERKFRMSSFIIFHILKFCMINQGDEPHKNQIAVKISLANAELRSKTPFILFFSIKEHQKQ